MLNKKQIKSRLQTLKATKIMTQEWEKETPKGKKLPAKVKSKSTKKKR
jgi:hypothetical protein